MGCWNR
ncbi:hypothetical protein AYI68_g7467, partial [Smittium mucronatum]